MKRLLLLLVLFACLVSVAGAHELRPAFLQLQQVSADRYEMLWKTPARGPEKRLALYVMFDEQASLAGNPRSTFTGSAFVERAMVTRPGGLSGSSIRIDGLAGTMTDALVRIERLDGGAQIVRLTPQSPSFQVVGAQSFGEVAKTYLLLGIEHILSGIDHLLFVFALLLIVKGWRRLVATVTAFTAAHSITLAAATLGYVSVPQSPVEAVIALSILFLAVEIVHGRRGRSCMTERFPWVVAFIFGLLHGFGFAGALTEIGLPQQSIPFALLFFNFGVEFGQLLFVASVLLLGWGLRRFCRAQLLQRGEALASFAIGVLAAFWLFERVNNF